MVGLTMHRHCSTKKARFKKIFFRYQPAKLHRSKNKIDLAKRDLKMKPSSHFKSFCNSLNRITPTTSVWKVIRSMRNNSLGSTGYTKLTSPKVALTILENITTISHICNLHNICLTDQFLRLNMQELNEVLWKKKDFEFHDLESSSRRAS